MSLAARKDGLLVQEVGDELVVYDQLRNRAHRLNPMAALVWRQCDGRSFNQLASAVQEQASAAPDEDVVWSALEQLERANLLCEPVEWPLDASSVSRRQLVRRLGVTAALALALPVVTTINVPASAQFLTPPDKE